MAYQEIRQSAGADVARRAIATAFNVISSIGDVLVAAASANQRIAIVEQL